MPEPARLASGCATGDAGPTSGFRTTVSPACGASFVNAMAALGDTCASEINGVIVYSDSGGTSSVADERPLPDENVQVVKLTDDTALANVPNVKLKTASIGTVVVLPNSVGITVTVDASPWIRPPMIR
jgi:hypothetical protein